MLALLWETDLGYLQQCLCCGAAVPLLCLYHSQVPQALLEVDTERGLSTYLTSNELFQESTSATGFGGDLGQPPWAKGQH